MIRIGLSVILCLYWLTSTFCEDITKLVLGLDSLNGYPVAYGDFNSDEMTDVFVVEPDEQGHQLKILFGSDEPPFLRDFNVTYKLSKKNTNVI